MTKRERTTAFVITLLVVLAGCGGVTDAPGERATPSEGVTARVTDVVDGDTVDVRFADGTVETVRLVGVDTPEVRGGVSPDEFGVPDTEAGRACLREFAARASDHAERTLGGKRVTLRYDDLAGRRGGFGRLLAYVVVDGTTFNADLLERGYARLYDTPFRERERYRALEGTAREERRGLWACLDGAVTPEPTATATLSSDASLVVASIHADAAGNDNENLNDEYVVFRNAGTTTLDLTGWTVTDDAGHSYVFDDRTLDPGAELTLRTGAGTDGQSVVYWGRTGAVWNNGGDVVRVTDANGRLVVERRY